MMTDIEKFAWTNMIVVGNPIYEDATALFTELFDDCLPNVIERNKDKINLLMEIRAAPINAKINVSVEGLMERLFGWIPEHTEWVALEATAAGKLRKRSDDEMRWIRQEANLHLN